MPTSPSSPDDADQEFDEPFLDTTPSRWSRIRRLGALGDKPPAELTPHERAAWRADFERFVTDYRSAIVAVVRVRQPHGDDAEQLADDFLAEVGAQSRSLRGASPEKCSFRRYLQGWLHNYGRVRHRRELTTEHRTRRAGNAYEHDPPDDAIAAREHHAWVRALVRRAVARLHDHERPRKPLEDTHAFALARFHGVPLPSDDAASAPTLTLDELVVATRITRGGVKNRLTRARELFRSFLEPLLRDTVESKSELRTEARWFFGVLDDQYPGLHEPGACGS